MYYLRRLLEMITYPLRALLSTPSRLFSGSRRLLGMSLPARIAWLMAVALVMGVIISFVVRSYMEGTVGWVLGSLGYNLVIVALVFVIPIVLYIALKLWLEGEISPFPDIDRAWKAGLAELQQQGIDLAQTPLFLVLGSAGEAQEKGLFDASALSLNVREYPKGPAALHWFANADGVYLCCTEVGSMSKTAHLGREAAEEESARPGPMAPRPGSDALRGTIVADGPAMPIRGSAVVSSSTAPAAAARSSGPSNIRGTMIVGGAAGEGDSYDSEASAPKEKRIVRIDTNEANLQERRLEYLCRILRRARLPLSPLNGLLALLPFGLIGRSVPESNEVQRAAKRDLAVLLRGLMVRCPVSALVVGMEEHGGFQELVRRVGRDRAAGQRFGKGFNLSNPPLPERLEALAVHACGAFEDWVYTLFREKGSLSKPGNTRLYALLCKIRRDVQNRLANILAGGFGHDPEEKSHEAGLLFGGCYFAATGDSEDRQAFVKSVFDKLPDQQEELQWTDRALGEDNKFQFLSNLFLGIDTLLLIGLVVLIWHRFRPLW
ncbi:MAG: hypothetical protein IT426_17655 [Pirellulales bacterium]|nr:hypothetical protein [Pirellulales bacterium]